MLPNICYNFRHALGKRFTLSIVVTFTARNLSFRGGFLLITRYTNNWKVLPSSALCFWLRVFDGIELFYLNIALVIISWVGHDILICMLMDSEPPLICVKWGKALSSRSHCILLECWCCHKTYLSIRIPDAKPNILHLDWRECRRVCDKVVPPLAYNQNQHVTLYWKHLFCMSKDSSKWKISSTTWIN